MAINLEMPVISRCNALIELFLCNDPLVKNDSPETYTLVDGGDRACATDHYFDG